MICSRCGDALIDVVDGAGVGLCIECYADVIEGAEV
jgi:hypothetical protein